ncbi:MAG: YfcE family phosphodiesterase [Sedimentisphaerales bacterium]|jgi:putative phosphoesterase
MRSKILKIAVLSDVHGNLPALDAVLADCAKQGEEQIWYLGDFVGYVPFPNEVIERLQKENAISIIGNYDLKVIAFVKNARQWKKNKLPEKYSAFEWNYKTLTSANKRYLQQLPKERRIKIAGLDVLLTHGSPADNEEGISSAMPAKRLNELAKIAKADVVLCGHTHRPFKKRVGGVLFVNAGSVGRPEGDTSASYAILNFANGRVTVRHCKVEYDIDKATNAIRKAALSAGLADVIEKAASLDALKQQQKSRVSDNVTDEKKLEAVLSLAEKCNYEKQHTHQVEKLALQLFDGLTGLHRLGDKERFLLLCGAILHDIGWIEGQKVHHKVALKIIMDDTTLPFDFRDKSIIALLARYHRKRLPADKHAYYRELSDKDKTIIQKLAGILRLADGLDCTHSNLVERINCNIKGNSLLLNCVSKEPLDEEFSAADDKADLLKQVLGKKIIFRRKTG